MVEEDVLEDVGGNAGLDEGAHHALADEDRLTCMFDDDGVAGHQRRGDRVDRGHVRIVPRRDDEDDAMRLARDAALEAVALLDHQRLQRSGGDRGDIVRALVEAFELAAVAHRPAHLPGKLRHHLVDHFIEAGDT
ncbi:hypothetical protein D9M72_521250 [compost metagenome]